MKVLVEWFHPLERKHYQSEYEIDNYATQGMTVMDLLVYITENIDPTLGIYSHSVCNHGICKRCAIRINGMAALACTARVKDYDSLHLAPPNESHVVRDLVVYMDKEG